MPAHRWSCLALITLLVGTALGLVPLGPSARADTAVTITGHGFGHGRGLGQWGAFGYAVDIGSSSDDILNHYYGGTTAGSVGGWAPRVLMRARSGKDTYVYLENGALTTNVDGALPQAGDGNRHAVLIRWTGTNSWHVWDAPGCGGPWLDRGVVSSSEVQVTPSNLGSESTADMLQLCEESGNRYLRGKVVSSYFSTTLDGAQQRTINLVNIEDYLRSVVPSESPSSWGTAGGGKGMNALRAQAVAARSYVSAGDGRWGSADTCDDTFCQVYRGRGFSSSGFTSYEASTTDQAVHDTAGLVRVFGDGSTARTEFSSSTGGWTAGGQFPAVVDDGDATVSNPNHNWSLQVSTATVQDRFDSLAGRDLGGLISLQVTARNGLGQDGGRVTKVRGTFTNGVRDVSGEQFRSSFGLRSNWFSFPSPPSPPDSKTTPSGGYVLTADGTLTPFGAAPAMTGPNLGTLARAVDLAGPSGSAGYVLDGWGGLHEVGGAPPAASSYYQVGVDGARDVVVRADGASGYVLDAFGGLYAFGGAVTPTALSYYQQVDLARRVVLRADEQSGYVLTADGALHEWGGANHVSTATLPTGVSGVGVTLRPDGLSGYVVGSNGALFAFGGAPGKSFALPNAMGADQRPDGISGYAVDQSGGILGFGGATAVTSTALTSVRDIALRAEPSGYVLDGWGGLHEFGGAPSVSATSYWPGWDIARAVATLPNGGGYVLDGWGGVHPFAAVGRPMPATPSSSAYWPGWDIARDIAVVGSSGAGYVLDGWGGVHPIGGAPAVLGTAYWPGWDIARRLTMLPDGTGGYVLDGWGGLHPFALGSNPMPPNPNGTGYWPGSDVARGVAMTSSNGGFVLDSWGGVHTFGSASGVGSWYGGPNNPAIAAAGDPGTNWFVYLDVYGGLHTAPDAAPAAFPTSYWSGQSVTRGVALLRH